MSAAVTRALRTPAQNNRMHGLLAQLRRTGLDDDGAKVLLRDLCRQYSGQDHSSRLSRAEADLVIRALQGRVNNLIPGRPPVRGPSQAAERVPWGPRGAGPRKRRLVTAEQRAYLSALFSHAGMGTPEQQVGFCQRQCKHDRPRTMDEFDQVCEPLKAIIRRKTPPEAALLRVRALQGHPALDEWKQNFVEDLARQLDQAEREGRLARVLSPGKLAKLIECEVAVGVGTV